MDANKWQVMKNVAKVYDIAVVLGSFLSLTFLRRIAPTGLSLSEFLTLQVRLEQVLFFALILFAWHNILSGSALYISKRLTPRWVEAFEVGRGTLFACLVLFLAAKAVHVPMITSSFAMWLWVLTTSTMIFGRMVARSVLLVLRRHRHNTRHLLIVGTNERAIEFSEWVAACPELGYQVVGFVDDEWAGLAKFEASGHKRCCDFTTLSEFLRHNIVDEAVIYLPLRSYYAYATELVAQCEQQGILTRVDSQIFKARKPEMAPPDLERNLSLLPVAKNTNLLHALLKRSIDLLVSLTLLILIAPVFAIVAIFVKCTSAGPIFFSQTRVGLNKRMFRMYKFRTMIADAEKVQDELLAQNEMSGPVFKIKNDPRITPLGRILRKASIDELPQLLNVLKGEMSLVGPRAMSLRDYQLFDQDSHRRRFSVRPGITCLWQIYGRNSIGFEQWMELDLQYIDKWSLWLDIKILAQTLPVVLKGTGAA